MTIPTSEDLLQQEPAEVADAELLNNQQAVLNLLDDMAANKVTPRAVHDLGEAVDAKSAPVTASIDAKIAQTNRALKATAGNAVEGYRQRLKDNEISDTTAQDIVDTLLVQLKTYCRSYKIMNGKVSIVLRTRSPGDQRNIHAELQRESHKLSVAYDTHLSLLHTAFSLVSYKTASTEKTFDHERAGNDAPAWRDALAFLQSVPTPTLMLIQSKVYEFETLISVVMSEGFEENF